METHKVKKAAGLALVTAMLLPGYAAAAAPKECPPALAADQPVVAQSMEQADINGGAHTWEEIVDHGELLFVAKFNACDGQGRPETTGGGDHRLMPTLSEEGEVVDAGQIAKLRTSAPPGAGSL